MRGRADERLEEKILLRIFWKIKQFWKEVNNVWGVMEQVSEVVLNLNGEVLVGRDAVKMRRD